MRDADEHGEGCRAKRSQPTQRGELPLDTKMNPDNFPDDEFTDECLYLTISLRTRTFTDSIRSFTFRISINYNNSSSYDHVIANLKA